MEEIKLLNYLNGLSDPEASSEVETWCMESDENRKELERLYFTVCLGSRHAALTRIDVDRSFVRLNRMIEEKGKLDRRPKSSWLKRWPVVAAAFMAGLICATSIFYNKAEEGSALKVETLPRQRAQVVLPDGSKVWLNASTSLTYTSVRSRKERSVTLEGEAYFEVARNEKRPFVVQAKNVKTEVLGTKFNVRAKPDEERVITTLLEGLVRIVLPNQGCDGFILRPGQSVRVNTHTLQSELKDMICAHDVLLWIDGRIDFRQATLWEITKRLERYYDVQFEFKAEHLKNENFTCLFRTDDKIEDIMDALTLTKRFRSKIDGKRIVLSAR